jgi:DNA-binding transcriptional ArsR family regulator
MYQEQPPGPRVVIRPSIAVELEWVLAAAARPEKRADNAILVGLYAAHPGLAERVRDFWGVGPPRLGVGCEGHHLELLVLANHGGLLYGDDGDALVARLETLCATAPLDLPLPSEAARDRTEVLDRLAQLRKSRALRRRYVALVDEVWHALRDAWIDTAQPVVAAAVEARLRMADRGPGWEDAIGEAEHFDGLLNRLVADLAPDAELAVVPAYFTHRGLLVSLPGVLVLGVRTGPLEPDGAAERARTAALARRLRAVADPTRLAIVAALVEGPRTVTELAHRFALAQPTVSNHIKVLEAGGMVTKTRNGTRRELRVEPDAIAALVRQLEAVLGEQPR